MTKEMRKDIEKMVDEIWKVHDKSKCEKKKEDCKTDVMELLSKLPENEAILRIVQ